MRGESITSMKHRSKKLTLKNKMNIYNTISKEIHESIWFEYNLTSRTEDLATHLHE